MTESPITEKRIPLSTAAVAAGVSPVRLRHWLDRGQLVLDAEEERDSAAKHRRFSFVDVIRIGIVGRLVRYGLKAGEASEKAEDVLSSPQFRQLRAYGKTPPEAVYLTFRKHVFLVWFDETEGEFRGEMVARFFLQNDDWRPPSPVFLTVDVAEITNTAFRRLKETER